jgi:hypothetical protein
VHGIRDFTPVEPDQDPFVFVLSVKIVILSGSGSLEVLPMTVASAIHDTLSRRMAPSLVVLSLLGSVLAGQDLDREAIRAAWAFFSEDEDAIFLAVVFWRPDAATPELSITGRRAPAVDPERIWETKRICEVQVSRIALPPDVVGSIRVRAANGIEDQIAVVRIERARLSSDTIPRARRVGIECTRFARAALESLVHDNGFLRGQLNQILGRLDRWGKAASIRAFWHESDPIRAAFLARQLRTLVDDCSPIIEYHHVCEQCRDLSMAQANFIHELAQRRLARLRDRVHVRESWFERTYREDIAKLARVVDGPLGEHLFRLVSLNRGVPTKKVYRSSRDPSSGRMVVPRVPPPPDVSPPCARTQEEREIDPIEEEEDYGSGVYYLEQVQNGPGCRKDRVVTCENDRAFIKIAATRPVSGWRVRTESGAAPVPIVAEERRSVGLVTLEVALPSAWYGTLIVSADGFAPTPVLVSRYKDAGEVTAFSRLGLGFLGSRDPLVREEARRLVKLGSTAHFHQARRAASGPTRLQLERFEIGAVDVSWNVEEFATRHDLSLEVANAVYEIGTSLLRHAVSLRTAKQQLAHLLPADAVRDALELIDGGDRPPR